PAHHLDSSYHPVSKDPGIPRGPTYNLLLPSPAIWSPDPCSLPSTFPNWSLCCRPRSLRVIATLARKKSDPPSCAFAARSMSSKMGLPFVGCAPGQEETLDSFLHPLPALPLDSLNTKCKGPALPPGTWRKAAHTSQPRSMIHTTLVFVKD
uniref:Uncharacterized protein n=1 Tax=Crocodylus porosus TaxID=8502 RepID=A0A7M4F8Y4_CROPO